MHPYTAAMVLAAIAGQFANAFAVPDMFRRQGQNNAKLTLGKTYAPLSTIDGAKLVGDGLRDLCGDTGCDGGSSFESDVKIGQFETFGDLIDCTWTVTASGNYDNNDQKEYMIDLLTTSLTDTATVDTITVSVEDNPLCTHQGQPSCTNVDEQITTALNFQQVVLNLESGANTAELSYNLAVQCRSGNDWDCPSFVSDNLKDALSAVPGVGAVIAQVFDIGCA
ncbi:hypothetical protein FGRMN_835 [Fusarium graminum]|nr:hypothetical protein FGRMN_835 [Fusarium graminum]